MPIELKIRMIEGNKAIINSKDAMKLYLDEADIAMLWDDTESISCVVKVHVDSAMPTGFIGIDMLTAQSLETDEDCTCIVEKFSGALKYIDKVTFGLEPTAGESGETLLMKAKSFERELLDFMDKRPVVKGQKFQWDLLDANITIIETAPPLMGEEVALISKEVLKGFEYQSMATGILPFDGILLLDISASMGTTDMLVRHLSNKIDHLKGGFRESPILKSFLYKFNDGTYVERYNGAALAALIYLSEKVGRGKGEKIGIVTFSDYGKIIQFGNKDYYDVQMDTNILMVAENIVRALEEAENTTNLSDGLRNAIEISKQFEHSRMKMFVILTDGYPEYYDNEENVREIVDNRLAPRKDLIVCTAGLGSAVNTNLLQYIARKCRGSYIHVDDLNQLASWYAEQARSLKMKADFGDQYKS